MNAAGVAKQGVGRGVRTAHKYIQKIEENGKTRYFYTQEELKAYYAEKKTQVQNTANQVKDRAKAGMGEAQAKANQARLRAERIGQEFQKKTSDTVQTAKNYGEAVKNYRELDKSDFSNRKEAYDKLMSTDEGRKLRETHQKVWNKLDETAIKAASHLNGAKEYNEWKKANEEYYKGGRSSEEARDKADKAWEAYSKTAHYKFLNDNFVVNAQTNGVKQAVSDSANEAKDKANEAASKASSKIKKAAHDTKEGLQDAADDVKEAAGKASAELKKAAKETKEMLKDKLSSTNGTPGNGVKENGETRSMLGSYAMNIPTEPKKLKEWADNGKQQAQKILDQAEQEYKQIEQDFKDGKYTQQQLWIAQGIMEDLRDEMSEWDALSGMNEEALMQLFGPLIRKK